MFDLPMELRGFGANLGCTITELSGDLVRATMTVTPKQHQPYGIVHGGVYCAVIEEIASTGAMVWFSDRGHVVGVSNVTNFVRAVREGELSVEATPLQRGRTQQLWQVFITDEQQRLVAKGEVRLANIADADTLGTK